MWKIKKVCIPSTKEKNYIPRERNKKDLHSQCKKCKEIAFPMQKIKIFAFPVPKIRKICIANAKNKKKLDCQCKNLKKNCIANDNLFKKLLCSYWTLYLTDFCSQYLHCFNAVSFAIYWLSYLQLFHCKQKDIWLTA